MDGNFINNLRAVLGFGGSPASGSVIRDTVDQLRGRSTVEGHNSFIPGGEDMNETQTSVFLPMKPAQRRAYVDNPYTERSYVYNILPGSDGINLKQDQYGNNPRLYVTYDVSGNIKSVKGIDDIAALNEEFANNIKFRDGDFGTDRVENSEKYFDLVSSLYENGYLINSGTRMNDNRYRNLNYFRTFSNRIDEGNV